MLFTKIRQELTAQLSDNLKKVNDEINEIRSKQSMLSTMESRKAEEQKAFTESMQKPAEMLEKMKSQWETIMSEQNETMRELVNQTVTETLQKQRRAAEADPDNSAAGVSSQTTKYFEERIKNFEAEFQEKE